MMRRATLPPVAARPLDTHVGETGEDARSVRDEEVGARKTPGAAVPHEALRVTVAPLAVTYTTSRPSSDSVAAAGCRAR